MKVITVACSGKRHGTVVGVVGWIEPLPHRQYRGNNSNLLGAEARRCTVFISVDAGASITTTRMVPWSRSPLFRKIFHYHEAERHGLKRLCLSVDQATETLYGPYTHTLDGITAINVRL